MSSLREKPWLNSVVCDWAREAMTDEDWFAMALYFMGVALAAVVGMLLIGFPVEFMLGFAETESILSGGVAGMVSYLGITNLSLLYAGRGLSASGYSYYTDLRWNFPERVREYFSLDSTDRALYPENIIELLRDPDLTNQQKHTLNKRMSAIYDEIQEREKAKRILTKREVDVDHVLEYMADSVESVRVETKTYKEFL